MARRFSLGAVLALVALLAVALSQRAAVRWTNFGGVDEWLQLELNGRGIFSMPHSNRPLIMLWSLPGALLSPHRFEGYRVAHLAYATLVAWLTFGLVRILEPGARRFAFLAGAFAVAWAPLDMAWLAVVQTVPNVALTALSLLALVLFVESQRRARLPLLVAAACVALLCVRSYEATLGLLAGAPLLLAFLPDATPRPPRRWLVASASWELALALAALFVLVPVWRGQAETSYQAGLLRLDLVPTHYLARLLRQIADQVLPLVPADPSELVAPGVALAVVVFLAGILLSRSATDSARPAPRRFALWALVGLGLAVLGHSVLIASASITGPTRAQFLSAPGMAILLAATIELLAGMLPDRIRVAAALALAALVTMVAAGHTLGMQREWDRTSYYPRQRDCLAALVRQAPGLRPGTLLLLIDEDGAWPFALTFRHAARLVYGDAVTAHALGGDQLLYSAGLRPTGIRVTPSPTIAGPWREQASEHRFDQVIVFRLARGGVVTLLEEWPQPRLPPLPAGAHYDPRATIANVPPPPGRRVLD